MMEMLANDTFFRMLEHYCIGMFTHKIYII